MNKEQKFGQTDKRKNLMSHMKNLAIEEANKKYHVKFTDKVTKEENYCKRPFDSYSSAQFFKQAIDITSDRYISVIEEVV